MNYDNPPPLAFFMRASPAAAVRGATRPGSAGRDPMSQGSRRLAREFRGPAEPKLDPQPIAPHLAPG
ncbi:hypothetical protein PGT21_022149 [Puccinia graminis f. sp. tritici]|uniref:Uncharacterized protein n=1 Tax=Puccinia graminis f. sp. tritici TaxID=56615 RepID=A0A5B0LM66_PUCGR|nr:hypothetical protein PGT21_022149 [Puccinia graminis f. sp. tritici]